MIPDLLNKLPVTDRLQKQKFTMWTTNACEADCRGES